MNLIKLLNQINIDQTITANPIHFLLFKESHFENLYMPMYWGGYGRLFNKEILNEFFKNEISYDEIIQAVDLTTLELPYQNEFLPLIKERLEEIKSLSEPVLNSEKMNILNSLILSSSAFISLPYIRKSIHKHELITLLALTEWEFWFQTCSGWGVSYTALTIKFNSIFDISELEIYLPYDELNQLLDKLQFQNEELYRNLESSKNIEESELFARLSNLNM
ncbi:hypothetical protein [Lysinibacillus capsici]|uniref:hypothetical protein n=1 Tax=Lysinibacillus capsici TaxID=2115968 RepID=UPI003081B963|nr:hypothetical protein ICJ70_13640 [Lysinibacillus capsici]